MKKNKSKLLPYLLLHFAIFVFSLSTICAKFAGQQDFMSPPFITLYGGLIATLGFYAIIWQQVLNQLPLTVAFANKAATLLWSLIWGVTIFQEEVSLNMLIGIIIVFFGVVLITTGSVATEKKSESQSE